MSSELGFLRRIYYSMNVFHVSEIRNPQNSYIESTGNLRELKQTWITLENHSSVCCGANDVVCQYYFYNEIVRGVDNFYILDRHV